MKRTNYVKLDNSMIVKNAIYLYIRMIIIMIINFYLSRVVLDILGVVDYGIYNLVGSAVIIFSFVRNTLGESVQRFLNYEMGKGKTTFLNSIFNTCLNSYILISVIIFFWGEIIWQLYGHKLNIPAERFSAATFTFHTSLLTFSISLIQIPFNATIVAYEKMGFYAKISIVEAIIKLLIIFLITYIAFDKLKVYAFLVMLTSILILFGYIFYCRRNFNICKYQFFWKKRLFYIIISYANWNMLGSLSSVLSESGVSLVFNIFRGVLLNAALGISIQVNTALMSLVTGYQTAFKPQVVKLFSSRNISEMRKLVFQASRYSYFLFFLISVPSIMNIDCILNIWLVSVPPYATIFCIFILIGSLIDATSSPFYTAIGATGNIRNCQMCISSVFLLYFLLTIVLLYYDVNIILILLSRILTRGIINFFVGLYFMQKQIGIMAEMYIKETFLPIVNVSFLPIVISLVFKSFLGNGILSMIVSVIMFEMIAILCIYQWGLKCTEKVEIKKYLVLIRNAISVHKKH